MVCKPLLNCYFWQFSLNSHTCFSKKLYFQFLSVWAAILSLRGLSSILEFSKLPKIAKKIEKSYVKNSITYLNTCESNFICLNSRFCREWQIFMVKMQFMAFRSLRMLCSKSKTFCQIGWNVKLCQDLWKKIATGVKLRVHIFCFTDSIFSTKKVLVIYVKMLETSLPEPPCNFARFSYPAVRFFFTALCFIPLSQQFIHWIHHFASHYTVNTQFTNLRYLPRIWQLIEPI